MAVTINASTSSGLAMTADGSGIMKLQSNGVTTNALAWVNFNGVTTTSIRSSYNVSSVTRNSTGDYTVNYTNTLSDANYAVSVSGVTASTADGRALYLVKGTRASATASQTTSGVTVQSLDAGTGAWPVIDGGVIYVIVFGN